MQEYIEKKKKINNLNLNIDELKKISSNEKIEREKNANLDEIKKNIELADAEFRNGNTLKSSLKLLNAAELSIDQIGDTRTKSRISNEISKLISLLKDMKNPKAYLDIVRNRKKKVREKTEFTTFKLLDTEILILYNS